jgi:TetR/AcrR family transcriptional regulator, regulator of cefoperazone and chloramphenicol sensitivity
VNGAAASLPASAPGERAAPVGGYKKGEETRQRILNVALKAFGTQGFKNVTTRQVARDAGVSLPALGYYFGGKEGLYLACAVEIVGRYEGRMLATMTDFQDALATEMAPAEARSRLKAFVGALAALAAGGGETEIAYAFVMREMDERGPAFDVLYERIWAPGVKLAADLIARVMREPETSPSAHIHALLILASLTAFGAARPISQKYLAWPEVSRERLHLVRRVIDQQIDRMG